MSLKSVLDSKSVLRQLSLLEDVKFSDEFKQIVLETKQDSMNFWKNAESLVAILKPIAEAITLLESDGASLATALVVAKKIRSELRQLRHQSMQSTSEKQTLKAIICNRLSILETDYSLVTYALSPGIRAEFSDQEKVKCDLALVDYTDKLGFDLNEIGDSYQAFCTKSGYFSSPVLNTINCPRKYWS